MYFLAFTVHWYSNFRHRIQSCCHTVAFFKKSYELIWQNATEQLTYLMRMMIGFLYLLTLGRNLLSLAFHQWQSHHTLWANVYISKVNSICYLHLLAVFNLADTVSWIFLKKISFFIQHIVDILKIKKREMVFGKPVICPSIIIVFS